MAQDAVEHDYHLVNPSPWPFVGSAAATVMAIGGVIWMKGMFGLEKHTLWPFLLGLFGVLQGGTIGTLVLVANEMDSTLAPTALLATVAVFACFSGAALLCTCLQLPPKTAAFIRTVYQASVAVVVLSSG